MSDLTQYKFSGLQLCKLVGISHNQFQSFKLAGLIDNKPKYTLNDVIYVGVSNVFRMAKMSWATIYNLYTEIFGSPKIFSDFINQNSLFKYDYICLYPTAKDNEMKYTLSSKDELARHKFEKHPIPESLLNDPNFTEYGFFYRNIFENNQYAICTIYIWKVLDKIIENSKHINLKVDVERVLLSA